MQSELLIADVAGLLPSALANERIGLAPCATGGNNRVYVLTAGDCRYLAKLYFRHPSDQRDRLKSEYAFLTYARRIGIANVPAPVACDIDRGIGIYEHIEGRKLAPDEIDGDCVDQAAEFFLKLNHATAYPHAQALLNASEACFSIAEHFAMVDARIECLRGIPVKESVDHDAREFIGVLRERWQAAKRAIEGRARTHGIGLDQADAPRCISPSDFGFHNALATRDRGICFLDFEYAGWDDSAKMAGDFFSHPAVPVHMNHYDRFLELALSYAPQSAGLAARARMLHAVFQIKWCCIILNDFLPEAARRRRFADSTFDEGARKSEQLAKARRLFERILLT